jgi:hypothetical protein
VTTPSTTPCCTGISARIEVLDQPLLDRIGSELLSEEAVEQLIAAGLALVACALDDDPAPPPSPLEDRRAARARLINEITVSPGGVVIQYGTHHHKPSGPPYGSWGWCEVEAAAVVQRSRGRAPD